MVVFIRKISKKDYLDTAKLIQQLFPKSEGKFNTADLIWVAESSLQLIGFIRVSKEKDKLLLNGLGVLPSWRGKGIGTLLLERALSKLQKSNLPIYLKVRALNPVIDLYDRFGFTLKKFGATHILVKNPKT